jgi:phosphotriesterase-related protein
MTGTSSIPVKIPRQVQSVLGKRSYDSLGITDAHNHVWIEQVPGADPAAPVLDHFDNILEELQAYRAEGGGSLLDCQPAGCGRNGRILAQLSKKSLVNIIACTGFHRRKYYPPDFWLFSASSSRAAEFFLSELNTAMEETKNEPQPVRAGFIKLALESSWDASPGILLEGAAEAARQAETLVEIHTEKGELAEKAVIYFDEHGVDPAKLVLCHMDKRPDICLHKELARFGALLEYDTFYRPKYDPEANLWPLIEKMTGEGFSDHVVLATDMAEYAMYSTYSKGPGLASLPTKIKMRLTDMGISENSIQQMLGGNIARCLAG